MSVPFRFDPESSKRPAQQDPFLEFESERSGRSEQSDRPPASSLLRPHDTLPPPPTFPPVPAYGQTERRESVINPSIAFAIGVAGLVTAAVGYYQMTQVLATRSQAPESSSSASAPTAPLKPIGRLEIVSEPAGAAVKVDGIASGVTPLTLNDIPSGRHEVVITRGGSSVTRLVELASGSTAVVTAVLGATSPPASAAPEASAAGGATGWITLDTPIELRILERGRPRGSTRSGRITLSAGSHELEFVNDLYEVRHTMQATVVAGRGTRVRVPLPSGSLSINAEPWADVWVNGSPVGTTPLANVSLAVGTHEVVLRHPTLGERKQTVLVKGVTPIRLGVSMR